MRSLLFAVLHAFRQQSSLSRLHAFQQQVQDVRPAAFLSHNSSTATGVGARGGKDFTINGKQPVEQLQPYTNHSLAVARAGSTPLVDSGMWQAQLNTVLQAGPSRYIYAPGIKDVEAHLQEDLKAEDSALAVSAETFNLADYGLHAGDGENIIGVKAGSNDGEYVLLGAHYDSIPRSGDAPGAEDNGSGVTTLLCVAKALQKMGTPKRSIHFVMFTAEEVGLIGSKAYVRDKQAELSKCKAGLVLDEVSFTQHANSERLIFETSGDTAANNRLIDTLAGVVKDVVPTMTYEVNYAGFGSDHMTLLQAGVPTVLVIERDNLMYADRYGHTKEDTVENVTPEFGAHVTSVIAQAVWDLANAE